MFLCCRPLGAYLSGEEVSILVSVMLMAHSNHNTFLCLSLINVCWDFLFCHYVKGTFRFFLSNRCLH